MTDDFSSKLKADIVSEACAWIVQIEEGNLTSADQVAFKEWINRSPVHKSEISPSGPSFLMSLMFSLI